ncbi:sialate O-acetylesterase [Mycolicibacterium arenosum]|uniref:Sialate O-acetylesterase n=1 Tax=Mycolicibacterium arenosum TaxID=2952157 RepID=A0ABT1M3Q9_9MYCO|nr:sialate O-acetylesterase [Mycolicibacterium sp. CAU 1645]MCP9273796.1 sialate O-acetylesterase [Mycolicibacterium sp. CAU 1645]
MRARRDPDGDVALWRLLAFEAKSAVKRRLVKRGTPVESPAEGYLIVPVLGQSNAYGMGFGLDAEGLDRPHPRVHQYGMSGPDRRRVVLATEPLLHEIPLGRVGFGLTFAKRLADATNRHVLLVPGARGDTSFTPKNGYTWNPADTRTRVNLYRNAVRAIDDALAQHPRSKVTAVLWHQGESDVPLTSGSDYRGYLDSVIDDLRNRYGSEFPFIIGQMVPEEMELSHKDYSVINAIHIDTPNRKPRTAFVAGERGCTNSEQDRHYNAAGLRAMGHAMWTSYCELNGDAPVGHVDG